MIGKPPTNEAAEQAVIACSIQGTEASRAAAAVAIKAVTVDDFYSSRNRIIWGAVRDLFQKSKPLECLTLTEALKEKGELDQAGGSGAVSRLLDDPPILSNIDEYVSIVKDYATRRRLLEVGAAVVNKLNEGQETSAQLLDGTLAALMNVAKNHITERHKEAGDAGDAEIVTIEDREEQRRKGIYRPTGIQTGFRDLDQLTGGLQPEEILVVAARPSVGKTSFAASVALNVAASGVRTCLFSLEMSAAAITRRLLSMVSGVDALSLRTGRLFAEDIDKLKVARDYLKTTKIAIDDPYRLSPVELKARARMIFARYPEAPSLIVVDYIGLMEASMHRSGGGENRQSEVAQISRSLKSVARELKCPIIVLSQLNREVEHRGNNKPKLSDLRDSGAVEQDADMVLFLYSSLDVIPPIEVAPLIEINCCLAKQRNGPTGEFQLTFNRPMTLFTSQALTKEELPNATPA